MPPDSADPHATTPALTAGPRPEEARGVLVLLHGRGASAEDILGIHEALGVPGLAAIAPQASGSTWYPHPFLSPVDSNQPWLDSALRRVDTIVRDLASRGVPLDRIGVLGFSQGACLTVEYAARNPRRYGALAALTGGLIGQTLRSYGGSLDGTPVFLGTSDPDPFVPYTRVKETEAVLTALGARVELRRYAGMPHRVNEEEIEVCRALMERMCA